MKHKIDPKELYNKYGELYSDQGKVSATIVPYTSDTEEETKGTKIQYTEYCMINFDALKYLHKNFNLSDIGRITLLPMMTKTSASEEVSMNTLYKTQRTPHNYNSLKVAFEMSSSRFSALFNKLLKKNIIAKATSYKDNKKINIIMLNPYLTRRHVTTSNEILELFSKLEVT